MTNPFLSSVLQNGLSNFDCPTTRRQTVDKTASVSLLNSSIFTNSRRLLASRSSSVCRVRLMPC